MYLSLPTIICYMHIQYADEVIFVPIQILRICEDIWPVTYFTKTLVTLPKLIYVFPVYVSNICVLTYCFKLINFVFQIFPFCGPEISISFTSYTVRIASFDMACVL